jgi:hypothetical protein
VDRARHILAFKRADGGEAPAQISNGGIQFDGSIASPDEATSYRAAGEPWKIINKDKQG